MEKRFSILSPPGIEMKVYLGYVAGAIETSNYSQSMELQWKNIQIGLSIIDMVVD